MQSSIFVILGHHREHRWSVLGEIQTLVQHEIILGITQVGRIDWNHKVGF